jgi:putative transcriptional regulator
MKNRLKELRIAKGWSDADLALELWISAETVRAIEAGKYEPPLSLAIEIARLLGQTVEAIFLCQDQSRKEDEP